MTSDELASMIAELRSYSTDHQHVEAKSARNALPKKVWQTLSAFANTSGGGVLILGLSEDKHFAAVGVQNLKKVSQDLASTCDTMVPEIRALVSPHEFEGETLIVAEIPEMVIDRKPCYYKGAGLTNGAYIRVADGDRRLTPYEVQVMVASRGQPQEDREPVEDASAQDLHPELLRLFLERLRSSRSSLRDRSDQEILRLTGVTVESDGVEALTLGGLLALGAEPQRIFPELSLTFVAYPGNRIGETGPRGERFSDDARIEGPIPLMIEPVLARLQRNMKRRSVVQGLARETQWEYPITAIREAVVNALAHRDLGTLARGTPVQVHLFADRLTVTNPGGLHGPVTIETLGDAGISSSRNATLMRILEDTPVPGERYLVCENRGSGIGAMFTSLRDAGMSPPEFQDSVATFQVRFPNHTLFDQATLEWLAEIGADRLSDSQRVGMALLWNGHTLSNATFRKFNDIDSRVATRELRQLVQSGYIEPQSAGRWTTYRLPRKDEADSQGLLPIFSQKESRTHGPKAVLHLLRREGAMSRAELAERLSAPDSTTRYWLRKLIDSGLVEYTTTSPKDPNVKYRIVHTTDG